MVDDLVHDQYLPAATEALQHFRIEALNVEAVSVSENVTFRITDGEGCDYSLRLHRPGYNTLRELESERQWSAALAKGGLQVQQALATREGRHFVLLDIPGTATRCYAGMTTWLPGSPLSDHLENGASTEERRRRFREIGRLTAKIHNQSAGWQQPEGFRRPILDVEGLLGEEPRWGRFWEHAALSRNESALLLEIRQRLRSVLIEYGKEPVRFSLIHADLDAENIIVDGDRLMFIDFDDSAFGWHMYDLASALIEHCEAGDFEALVQAILDGYRDERQLGLGDESTLPAFLLIRGLAIIGWLHQRPDHADFAYFLQVNNIVLAWAERLLETGRMEFIW